MGDGTSLRHLPGKREVFERLLAPNWQFICVFFDTNVVGVEVPLDVADKPFGSIAFATGFCPSPQYIGSHGVRKGTSLEHQQNASDLAVNDVSVSETMKRRGFKYVVPWEAVFWIYKYNLRSPKGWEGVVWVEDAPAEAVAEYCKQWPAEALAVH